MNNHCHRLNPNPISVLVFCFAFSCAAVATFVPQRASAQMQTGWEHTYAPPNHRNVLHAARLLDVESGKIIGSAEVLVRGDVAKVIEEVARPNFRLAFDLGHFLVYSRESLTDWLRTTASHISSVYVHSNDRKVDTHDELGRGVTDLRAGESSFGRYRTRRELSP